MPFISVTLGTEVYHWATLWQPSCFITW